MQKKKSLFSLFHLQIQGESPHRDLHLEIEQLEPRMMLNGDLGSLVFDANFEDANVSRGEFAFFSDVSGMLATGFPVEIQNNHPSVGPASQGDKHLELDGPNGIYVDINVDDTSPLALTFDYSPRARNSTELNAIEVYWQGDLIGTVAEDGSRNRTTEFKSYRFDVEGGSGRLEFRSKSKTDVAGLGGLLDNIRLYKKKAELGPLNLQSIDDQTIGVGGTLNVDADVLPPDDIRDDLRFRLVDGLEGMTIDAETGEITWVASQTNLDAANANNGTVVLSDPILEFQASFEDVDIEPGGYGFTSQTSGFTATKRIVEIQHNHPSVGPASLGNQHLELDITNGIYRDVETNQGDRYTLRFDYSPRPGVSTLGNRIEVWWDGELLGKVERDGERLRSTDFHEFEFDLSDFSGDLTRLEFRSVDPADPFGLGGLLDNIRLYRQTTEVIEPDNKFEVIVEVVDSEGRHDRESFIVCVEEVVENLPPVVEPIADQMIAPGEIVSLNVAASDPEDQTLTYALQGDSDSRATIDPATGEFRFETTADDEGAEYLFTVAVSDGELETTETFLITINLINRAPVISPIDNQTIEAGQSISFTVTATDPENQPLTFLLNDGSDPRATIDPTTGEFNLVTDAVDEPATLPFTIIVSDGKLTDSASFEISVTAPVETNNPPTLIVPDEVSDGTTEVDQAAVLNLDFDATDPDQPNDLLTFSLASPFPGAQIDPDTGAFSFIPTTEMLGQTIDFEVVVTDNGEPRLSDSHSFTVEVVSCAFDDDLTGWMPYESGGSEEGRGAITAQDCIATLVEGDSFAVSLEQTFVIQQNTALQFSFDELNFDLTDEAFVNDAFEVALVGADGNSLIDTFADGRDAFFNVTEGLEAVSGDGVTVDGNVVTVGLNGLKVGTEATVVFRLVNDDSDTQTSVQITEFAIIDSFQTATPSRPAVRIAGVASVSENTPISSREPDNRLDLPVAVTAGEVFVPPEITEPQPLTPEVEWFVDSFAEVPTHDQVMMAPTVIDMNQDGIPDIIFSTFQGGNFVNDGILRVISGDGGSEIWSLTDPEFRVQGSAGVAVGDIDNDGLPEVLALHENNGLMAVEHDGTFKWLSQGVLNGSFTSWGGPSLADLDHDGTTEIVFGATVLNADGTIRWQGNRGSGKGLANVVDLDGDGNPEIVAGRTAYRADGSIYWDRSGISSISANSTSSIGNFDDDPFPEVVSVINGMRLALYEHDGTPIWLTQLPNTGNGGAPTIADFDGDGEPEIGVAGASRYVVAETDGSVKWSVATRDTSSSSTGSSVFDFDGDGRAEAIYGDEFFLRIYDGETGEERYRLEKGSGTTFELPVIVDVDADGVAEIVAPANDYAFGSEKGIYVIGDDANWSTTRQIWNQHTYHITNVNDDGTIPAYEANSWEIYNNYRRNLQPTGTLLGEPIITARAPRGALPVGNQVILTGDAIAQGFRSTGNPNRIDFVTINGRPVDSLDATGKFFALVDLLPGGNEFIFEATDAVGQTTQAVLTVTGTQNATEINFSQFADVTQNLQGIYARTSYDNQNSILLVDLIAENAGNLPADGPLLVGVKNISEPSVSLLDVDGTLPDGTPFFDISNLIEDNTLGSGSQSETATIMFFNPLEIRFDYELVFLAQTNDPPEIVSLPITTAYYDNEYRYDVEATDASDDELTYAFSISTPGMEINATSGVITWSPTIDDYGLHDVGVVVSDGRGGQATQRFILNVAEAPPNRPPIIVSTPVTYVTIDSELANSAVVSKVVVANDEWTLSDSGFGSSPEGTRQFVENLTSYFADGESGRFLGYSNNFSINENSLAQTMAALGHEWVVSTGQFSIEELLQFDAVFVGGFRVDTDLLIEYVSRGGNIYLFAGTGTLNSSANEAMVWKPFLEKIGLQYASNFNGIGGVIPIPESPFPVLDGVELFQNNGNTIVDLDPSDNLGAVVARRDGKGLYAVYEGVFDVSQRNPEAIQAYRYDVKAVDPDTDELTYRLLESPTGMWMDPELGIVRWNPTSEQLADHEVTVEVNDGNGGKAEQSFIVCVHEDNAADTPVSIRWLDVSQVPEENSVVINDPILGNIEISTSQAAQATFPAPSGAFENISWEEFDFINLDGSKTGTNSALVGSYTFNFLDGPIDTTVTPLYFASSGLATGSTYTIDNNPIYLGDVRDGDGSAIRTQVGGELLQIEGVGLNHNPDLYQFEKESVSTISISFDQVQGDGTAFAIGVGVIPEGATNGSVITTFEGNFEPRLVNDAPEITSVPTVHAAQGETYQYNAVASDFDGDAIRWNLDFAPAGMRIDQETGMISWVPAETQIGEYLVVLSAYDAVGARATQRFQVEVTCNNLPPAIVSIPETAALSQRDYLYAPRAIDAEGDTLTWSLETAPDGMTIDVVRGFIRWQPAIGQIGSHEVAIHVSDGQNTAWQFYTVVVSSADDLVDINDPSKGTKGNRAPLITSTPSLGAIVDVLYQYQVETIELDDDAVSYQLVGAVPDGMTIDESGMLTWTPTVDSVGSVAVNVQAFDEFGATASQGFSLNVSENVAPIIESTPPNSILQGKTYRYIVNASDADRDDLIYKLVDGPQGMVIDGATGFLTWSTLDDPVAIGSVLDVAIRVRDSFGNLADQQWQVEVLEDTVAPTVSITILSNGGIFYDSLAEFPIDDSYLVQVLAYDNAQVVEKTLSIDGANVPLDVNGFAEISPTVAGQFELEATATDSSGLTGSNATTVILTNQAPEIVSEPPISTAANEDFTYPIVAEDLEGHEIEYSLIAGPDGTSVDPISGDLSIRGAELLVGTYEFTVRATDEFGAFTDQPFSLGAIDLSINHAPIFLSEPITTVPLGVTVDYEIETLDYNGDAVTYRIVEGGIVSELVSGGRVFRARTGQVGEFDFAIEADDGNGGVTVQEFTVTVTPPNRAPYFVSQPPTRVLAGSEFAYAPIVVDPDGDSLTFYGVDGPRNRQSFFQTPYYRIDSSDVLRWPTRQTDVGSHDFFVRVYDQWGAFADQKFTVEVVDDLSAPFVEVLANPNPVDVGETVTLRVFANDDGNVEELSLTVDGEPIELTAGGIGIYTTTRTGEFSVVATATDDDGNTTERGALLIIRDLTDVEAPVVDITSPATDQRITSFADVIGSVSDENLAYYSLSYRPLSGGNFVEFARGEDVVDNDVLGTFDPSTLANDAYVIRLYARDVNGQDSFVDKVVDVSGELKLGNFTLAFNDLTIPVGGIPIVVGRVYDSLNSNQQGEFGYGWRMEFRDVDLRTSVAPSGQEDIGFYRPFKDGSRIYLTLPGGKREGFTFRVERAGGLRGSLGMHYGEFVPDDGVFTEITTKRFELAFDSNQNVYTWGTSLPYNPLSSVFGGKLYATTKDGLLYEIDGATGDLDRVIDTNGNTVTFDNDSIRSSTGQKIDIVRDSSGQIVEIIDPMGNSILYAYDGQGDLVSVTDREGNVTQFQYDAPRPHFLTEVTDPLGRSGIRTEYDESGKLIKMIDVDGNETQLSYDPDNFVQQITDGLGNTTTYEFDERGNVLREVDALGGVTAYTYDIDNNELTITDPLGNTTEMTYNETGDVLTETDPLGNTTAFTYRQIQPRITLGNGLSFAGFVKPFSIETARQDANGHVMRMSYDGQGNVLAITNAEGQTNAIDHVGGQATLVERAGQTPTSFEYDANGFLTQSIDEFGIETNYEYDANGQLLTESKAVSLADGTTVLVLIENRYDDEGRLIQKRYLEDGVLVTEDKFQFDAVGNLVEQVDSLGRSTKFIYDQRGQQIEIVYPDETPDDDRDNPRVRTEYDVLGRRTALTDELGRRTEYSYDALGRIVETIYPDATPDDSTDNPRIRNEYDLAGRQVAVTDELGNRTEFVYDAAGRRTETILPDETPDDLSDNARIRSVFDAAGRRIRQIDPRGNATEFVYDKAGRLIETTFADGSSVKSVYDDRGFEVRRIDQNGVITEFVVSDTGLLSAVVSAAVINQDGVSEQPRTEYQYDERGSLLIQREASGAETRFRYDARGRRVAIRTPEGHVATTVFDALNRVVAETDFNGNVTRYEYDARDRVTWQIFSDGRQHAYTYFANGLVETASDSRGATRFEYDERDRLTKQTNPDGTSISYTYDDAGNRISMTSLSGVTTYTYDARNRLTTVTDHDLDVTSYAYDSMDLIRTSFSNGVVESRQYDSLNRLIYLETRGPGGILSSHRYTLDTNGNRIAVVEGSGRRVDYEYDSLNRLTKETITDPDNTNREISYRYDLVGNRVSRNDSMDGETFYSFDADGHLVSESSGNELIEYHYDANGNVLLLLVNGIESKVYHWDSANRLTAVDEDGDGSIDTEFEYDTSGMRVSKTSEGDVTKFLVDSNQTFGQVIEEYGPGGMVQVSYVHGHDLISQKRFSEAVKTIYGVDGLGSTRILTNSNGELTDAYDYDAFGRLLNSVGSTLNLYLFAGEQLAGLGDELYYLRARYLDSSTGRFLSRDPWPSDRTRPLTHNRYSYVENNSVNLIDPSGYFSLGEVATSLAISGIITSVLVSGLNFAASDRIVKSSLLVATVTASRRGSAGVLSAFIARTEPNGRYKQGIVVLGALVGAGRQISTGSAGGGLDYSLEFSSDTAYSPGILVRNVKVAESAFTGVFDFANVSVSVLGGVSQGAGGGFLGMSIIDQSGRGIGPVDTSGVELSAGVFAGWSHGILAGDCRSEYPQLCGWAEADFGGYSNNDVAAYLYRVVSGQFF